MSSENTSFKSNFGLNLKKIRRLGGWNQEFLANELGISRDTLSRYERGELSPSLEVFTRMLGLFSGLGLNAEDILYGIVSPKKTNTISSWGWAKGFSFIKGGAFRVGASKGDVLRLTKELVKQLPTNNPFSSVVDELNDYIYDLEDKLPKNTSYLHEFELLVPIASHSASLKVDMVETTKNQTEVIFDKYLAEKAKVDALQTTLNELNAEEKK